MWVHDIQTFYSLMYIIFILFQSWICDVQHCLPCRSTISKTSFFFSIWYTGCLSVKVWDMHPFFHWEHSISRSASFAIIWHISYCPLWVVDSHKFYPRGHNTSRRVSHLGMISRLFPMRYMIPRTHFHVGTAYPRLLMWVQYCQGVTCHLGWLSMWLDDIQDCFPCGYMIYMTACNVCTWYPGLCILWTYGI